ncbi:MAG: hypothetical protein CVT47_03085 [Thermoplasmata archaeon HGW-Thermoplasmata-2]|nr:MAG: hypothetical protein CVT47_03085 [Thermoplasmata archaeon HGW-Thermoplasmata-2]
MPLLETIFGTKTKIRIISALASSETPKTRHELAKESGGSLARAYEQIEELIGAGVLKDENGKITLDDSFPFYDAVKDLFIASAGHLSGIRGALVRIDALLGDGYYVGGFWAARQSMVPIDYDTDALLVNVLEFNAKKERRLLAVSQISGIKIAARSIERMPKDVVRLKAFGAETWIAGAERGTVEALLLKDCSAYGAYLVLLQNLMEGIVRKEKLLESAKEYGIEDFVLALLGAINTEAGKVLVALSAAEKKKAKKASGKVDGKELKNAVNTVLG